MSGDQPISSLEGAFTPGPWKVSSDAIWGKSPWNAMVRLAVIQRHSPANGIDAGANASLIAAAPALVEALKPLAAIPTVDAYGDEWADDFVIFRAFGVDITAGQARAARAALLQALGAEK